MRTLKILAVCAVLFCFGASSKAQYSGPPFPAPLTLDQLITQSEVIVYGRVVSKGHNARLGLPGTDTLLGDLTVLKGNVRSRTYSVNQFNAEDANTSGTVVGEKILWYLRVSPGSFHQSAGHWGQGLFQVITNEDLDLPSENKTDLFARSETGNDGLWDKKLWDKNFCKYLAFQYLTDHFKLEALGQREAELLSSGDKPCCPRWLPLEFLLAVTYARLEARSCPTP